MRPWRIGGSASPLFGLTAIVIITVASFLPIRPWWSIESISSLLTNAHNVQNTLKTNPGETTQTANLLESAVDQIERIEPTSESSASSFINILFDELRKSTTPTDRPSSRDRLIAMSSLVVYVGILLGLIRFILGLVGTRQLRNQSHPIDDPRLDEIKALLQAELRLPFDVALRHTSQLSTAATLGALQPIVLLPVHWSTWTDEELKAVLAHELAHVKNRDFAAQLFAQIGVVLHFYNPLVHWLSSRLRLEQELAADAIAASVSGGQRKYARLLAKLALDHENQTVGWPARAFLPTRQTFLRRLEMLRNSNAMLMRRGLFGRLVALSIIAMTSVVLIGLKQPGSMLQAQSPTINQVATQYDLRYVSDEGGIMLAFRPAELLAEPKMAMVAKVFFESREISQMAETFGLELKDVDQLFVGLSGISPVPTPVSVVIRTSKPIKAAPSGKPIQIGTAKVIELPDGTWGWQPNERTYVLNSKRNVQRFIEDRKVESNMFQSKMWSKLKDYPAVAMVDGKVTRALSDKMRQPNQMFPQPFSLLFPISDEADLIGIGATALNELKITAFVQCGDDKGTKTVEETLTAAMVLLKNGLQEIRLPANDPMNPVWLELLTSGKQLMESNKLKTEEKTVNVTMSIPVGSIPIAPIAAALTASRAAAKRSQSVNNLKQIALAFHNAHDAYRAFPNSKTNLNAANKVPMSWRVAILPFIEQAALYNEYRQDEPWDSENNIKLLARMPAIYRHADEPDDSTNTSYVVATGEEVIFGSSKKSTMSQIQDGTSNTLMVMEAKTNIPWTKPEDFEYASNKPLPQFGGFSAEGFNAALADGSVRFIAKAIDEKTLRALLTARGMEIIQY